MSRVSEPDVEARVAPAGVKKKKSPTTDESTTDFFNLRGQAPAEMLETQFYDENGAWSNDNEVLRRETTRKPTRHEDPEADTAILLDNQTPLQGGTKVLVKRSNGEEIEATIYKYDNAKRSYWVTLPGQEKPKMLNPNAEVRAVEPTIGKMPLEDIESAKYEPAKEEEKVTKPPAPVPAPAAPAPAAPSPPPITFTFDAGVSMGIALNDINGTVVVTDVAANTPAAMKQVPLGATLVSINGESTLGKLRADVLKMIGAVQGERKLTFMPKAAPRSRSSHHRSCYCHRRSYHAASRTSAPKYPVGSKCLVTRSTGEKSPCTVVAYDPKSRAYKVQVDGTDIYKMVREDMLEPAKQKNGDSPQKEPENILEALGQLSARIFGGAPREPEPADGANPMVEQEFSVDTTAIRVLVETNNVETTSHASATPRWMQAPLLHTAPSSERREGFSARECYQSAGAVRSGGRG